MSAAQAVVAAARSVIGVRYRLHGRDPAHGLDCVGLAAFALEAGGHEGAVPAGYAMRSGNRAAAVAAIDASGLMRATDARSGDLLLVQAGPGQLHLAIAGDDGLIHADAALRRVVERPGAVPWPVIGRWRIGEQ